jgi:hypothetical protein
MEEYLPPQWHAVSRLILQSPRPYQVALAWVHAQWPPPDWFLLLTALQRMTPVATGETITRCVCQWFNCAFPLYSILHRLVLYAI